MIVFFSPFVVCRKEKELSVERDFCPVRMMMLGFVWKSAGKRKMGLFLPFHFNCTEMLPLLLTFQHAILHIYKIYRRVHPSKWHHFNYVSVFGRDKNVWLWEWEKGTDVMWLICWSNKNDKRLMKKRHLFP